MNWENEHQDGGIYWHGWAHLMVDQLKSFEVEPVYDDSTSQPTLTVLLKVVEPVCLFCRFNNCKRCLVCGLYDVILYFNKLYYIVGTCYLDYVAMSQNHLTGIGTLK